MEARKEETRKEKVGKREEKEDCESQMEEGRDIVSQLFNYDLYEALQIVFLRSLSTAALRHQYRVNIFFRSLVNISCSLDSISLKRARCVCHEWDSFIQKALWASK